MIIKFPLSLQSGFYQPKVNEAWLFCHQVFFLIMVIAGIFEEK